MIESLSMMRGASASSRRPPAFGLQGTCHPPGPRIARMNARSYSDAVGPWTQWRGQADTADRRMRWLVLVSLLLHTPLTPLLALFGLFTWLSNPPDEGPEAPPI